MGEMLSKSFLKMFFSGRILVVKFLLPFKIWDVKIWVVKWLGHSSYRLKTILKSRKTSKITMRCHLTMLEWPSSKSLQVINFGKGMKK